MPTLAEQRAQALWYLEIILSMGLAYFWGGNDPLLGYDCSGDINEIFQSVGFMPHGSDATAHDLYLRYKDKEVPVSERRAGCLIFWLTGDRATHVEMMINSWQSVGASGGGRPQFDLYAEIQECPFLRSLYGGLSRPQVADLEGTFLLTLIKQELTRQQAIRQNGFIKPRPIDYRGSNYVVVDPFKE